MTDALPLYLYLKVRRTNKAEPKRKYRSSVHFGILLSVEMNIPSVLSFSRKPRKFVQTEQTAVKGHVCSNSFSSNYEGFVVFSSYTMQ